MCLISASIVLYKPDIEVLLVISNFLNTDFPVKLYLIDNSPTDEFKNLLVSDDRLEYIFNCKNIGYGQAHNIGIFKSISMGFKYHLVMNPDITFNNGLIEDIFSYMENNSDVGQLMPMVLYKNGETQKLCKLLPTPFDLLGRRFFKNTSWAKKLNDRYELNKFSYNKVLNTPCLSGCFMFLRNEVLEKVGGFDARFFMYLEDYDLTRRIHSRAKTIFYPYGQVFHGFKKESYYNPILLKYHIFSAVNYFNKWGWFLDPLRRRYNREVLSQL
jgi:GT2 family glycosyltransferase